MLCYLAFRGVVGGIAEPAPPLDSLDPSFTQGYHVLNAHLSWPSYTACFDRVGTYVERLGAAQVPLRRRSAVLYHMGPVGRADPLASVFLENLRVFFDSLALPAAPGDALVPPFVIVNLVGGRGNSMWEAVQAQVGRLSAAEGERSCIIEWGSAESDILTHLQTLALLGLSITDKLGTVFALNQGVRGPLPTGGRVGLDWLGEYSEALFATKSLALVGPLLSCQFAPHLQTHMFALKTVFLPTVLNHGLVKVPKSGTGWLQNSVMHQEVGLSDSLLDEGIAIASMADRMALGRDIFLPQHCPHTVFGALNPSTTCMLNVSTLGFVKFGGELMRKDLLCKRVVDEVTELSAPRTREGLGALGERKRQQSN